MMEGTVKDNRAERIPEEEEIDLREYWRVIVHHKWSIFGLAFLFALLAALSVLSMKPIYSASATLLIEAQYGNVATIEELYGVKPPNFEYYQTQRQILGTRKLAEKVVDRLDLTTHPEFIGDVEERDLNWREWISFDWKSWLPKGWLPEKPVSLNAVSEADSLKTDVIDDLMGRLSVQEVRDSQLVTISFEAADPEVAAMLANTLADVYIENDLDARLQMTAKATSWLAERLRGLKKKLEQSEKALQEYREREKLVEMGGVTTLTASQLQDLSQKLVFAQQERAAALAAVRQARQLKNQPLDQMESIPTVLNDPLIKKLREAEAEAERKVSALIKRYGPKHPKMIQARSELNESRTSLQRQVRSLVAGLEKQYEVAQASESSIRSSIAAAKGEMQQINRKGYELTVLEREVESNRQLYDQFLNRVKETGEADSLNRANARIADPAVAAQDPIKPKKKLIVVIAGTLGLFLGILLAFLFEHLDNTVKRASDLEERLRLPILGLLPHLKLKKGVDSPLNYARDNRQSFFVESIRTVRTSVLLSCLDDPHKIIVVTSSIPGEGKSTVAMNLADSLCELHKVLLIDGDMRRPTVAGSWGLDKQVHGLSEFVSCSAKLAECVHQTDKANLFIMPSGVVPPNPLELLSSQRFSDALGSLRKTFDHIIIDSAPALAVSDALLLSSYANGVIYVVKADSTPYPAAQEGVKRLRQVNAHLIGGVLNDIPQGKKKGGYSYGKHDYYGGSFYGPYGYSKG